MTIEALLGEILTELRGIRDVMDLDRKPAPERVVFTPGQITNVADSVAEVLAPIQATTAFLMGPAPTEVFGKTPIPTPAGQPVAVPAAAASHSNAGPAELDTKGLPWDGRIHASSKAKVADGSWRQKRGVDPDLVKSVEAELRQTMAAPAAPGAAWVPPVPAPTEGLAAQPWPIPPQPAVEYSTFAQTLMTAVATGTLTPPQIDAACQKYGVPSFPALGNRTDLIPSVMQELGL